MKKHSMKQIALYFILFFIIVYSVSFFNIDFCLEDIFVIRTISSLTKQIESEKSEIEKLKLKIEENEKILSEGQKKLEERVYLAQDIYNQIDELKMICGRTDVRGPGITVRIADNTSEEFTYDVNEKIVHDIDVRAVINDLIHAGAEAVAINGKRIVSTTEVVCSGPVIKVNGEVVAAPFFIKAIGNSDDLMNAITSVNSYAYNLKYNYGIDITAMKNYVIAISAKSEDNKIKYAECVEEGE